MAVLEKHRAQVSPKSSASVSTSKTSAQSKPQDKGGSTDISAPEKPSNAGKPEESIKKQRTAAAGKTSGPKVS